MRQLIDDFLSQGWFMKGMIAWGSLCMLVMVTSLFDYLIIFAAS